MNAITVDLRVADPQWACLGEIELLASSTFAAARAVMAVPASGEVALLLTNDAEMQALNATWRGKDAPTDVLSFSSGAAGSGFLGDIALGFGICARDATTAGRDLGDHTRHLLIHGLLHLMGHDHLAPDEAAEMESLEVAALASLGVPDPYS